VTLNRTTFRMCHSDELPFDEKSRGRRCRHALCIFSSPTKSRSCKMLWQKLPTAAEQFFLLNFTHFLGSNAAKSFAIRLSSSTPSKPPRRLSISATPETRFLISFLFSYPKKLSLLLPQVLLLSLLVLVYHVLSNLAPLWPPYYRWNDNPVLSKLSGTVKTTTILHTEFHGEWDGKYHNSLQMCP